MEQGLRDCCRSIRIGKILIQSDEETHEAKVYYAKFPQDIHRRKVLLMYPIMSRYHPAWLIFRPSATKSDGLVESRLRRRRRHAEGFQKIYAFCWAKNFPHSQCVWLLSELLYSKAYQVLSAERQARGIRIEKTKMSPRRQTRFLSGG